MLLNDTFFWFSAAQAPNTFCLVKTLFFGFQPRSAGKNLRQAGTAENLPLSFRLRGSPKRGKKKKVAPQTLKLEGIDTWKMSPGKSGRLDCLRVALRCPILCVCVCTYGPLAFLLTAEPSLLKQRSLSLVPFAHHPANFLLRGGGALHAAALSVRPSLLCVSVCVCPLLFATR